MKNYKPEGKLISAQSPLTKERIEKAYISGETLEARVILCDNEHNLHLDLGAMKGIIPREEGAIGIDDGSVRDIALISRVNKPVAFKVTDFDTDAYGEKFAVLSRRANQEECVKNYISSLKKGDVIAAKITHLEGFGAFADIGAGIVALMPIDAISVSRIPHPNARFTVGDDIKAVIKDIADDGKITLSHKELLGTWEQNAACFNAGETVPGIIRSVEKYGVFVELAPNFAGLAEPVSGLKAGQPATVYIKSMIPERMKVKLIIVDAFDAEYPPEKPQYFTDAQHISHWIYSPESCERLIESVF